MTLLAGLHRNVSEDDYHSDPGERPSLSSSIANTIIEESPAHAWLEHPKLGGKANKPTRSMDRGTMLHALLLGGREPHLIDARDYKTKAAQKERDEAHDAGETPMLVGEWANLQETASLLRAKLATRGVTLAGDSEVTVIWERDGVLCRGRIDHLITDGAAVIQDLKFCASSHPKQVDSRMCDYGYAIQLAAYREAVETILPQFTGRVTTQCVFCEVTPPHCITIAEPDGTMRSLGDMRWNRARRIWKQCLRTNRWPEYVEGIYRSTAKPWTLEAEMALQYSEEIPI